MENNITTYKPKLSVVWGGVFLLAILFFGLTLPLIIVGEPVDTSRLLGLGGMWLLVIALTICPLGFKLEVGDNLVRTSFFNFKLRELRPKDIQQLEYGKLLRFGGLGVGRGVKGWEKTKRGGIKYFSLGEAGYGKEAIAHARRVLESQLSKNTTGNE